MTISIKQTYKTLLYGYNPDEYMPIYVDTKWANRGEFVRYRIKIVLRPIGKFMLKQLIKAAYGVNNAIERSYKITF